MRTKPCEGVLRLDLVMTEPRPELYLLYDGLAGIDSRSVLKDVVGELGTQEGAPLVRFLKAMRERRSGWIRVYFTDYVSYGIGGGDAVGEFYFGSMMILHEPARAAHGGAAPAIPEHLTLVRHPRTVPIIAPRSREPIERLSLEAVSASLARIEESGRG